MPCTKKKQSTEVPATSPTPGDHESYIVVCDCQPQCTCQGCIVKQKQILKLQHQNTLLKEDSNRKFCQHRLNTTKSNTTQFLKNDRSTRIYTGLPCKKAFDDLFNLVHPSAKIMNYWTGIKKTSGDSTKCQDISKSHRRNLVHIES